MPHDHACLGRMCGPARDDHLRQNRWRVRCDSDGLCVQSRNPPARSPEPVDVHNFAGSPPVEQHRQPWPDARQDYSSGCG